jgi:hypothetical protein
MNMGKKHSQNFVMGHPYAGSFRREANHTIIEVIVQGASPIELIDKSLPFQG